MTERKPQGLGWESWVDRLVREADERGEFDDLPGQGQPIPGAGHSYDENWWLKGFLDREGLSLLPGSLRLDLEVEKSLEQIALLPSEPLVRHALEELNNRIRHELARITSGPPSKTTLVDIDRFLSRWRSATSDHAP